MQEPENFYGLGLVFLERQDATFCELHSLHCSSNTTPLCLISGNYTTSTPPFSFCDALVNLYMPAHFQTTVRVNISNAWHQSCKSSWTARAFTNFNVYQVYSNHICNYADYIRLLIHSRLAHTVQEGGKPQTHWDCHRRLFICTKHWLNAFGLPKLTELEYIGISRNMTRRLLMIPCTRMLMDARRHLLLAALPPLPLQDAGILSFFRYIQKLQNMQILLRAAAWQIYLPFVATPCSTVRITAMVQFVFCSMMGEGFGWCRLERFELLIDWCFQPLPLGEITGAYMFSVWSCKCWTSCRNLCGWFVKQKTASGTCRNHKLWNVHYNDISQQQSMVVTAMGSSSSLSSSER